MKSLMPIVIAETPELLELLDYEGCLSLLTDLDEYGFEADKREDKAECKRTEKAIERVHEHVSQMWLAEDELTEGLCTVH